MAIKENIEKAVHDVGFLVEDLIEANRYAAPLEHIVLLGLIEDARKLQTNIMNIKNAIGG